MVLQACLLHHILLQLTIPQFIILVSITQILAEHEYSDRRQVPKFALCIDPFIDEETHSETCGEQIFPVVVLNGLQDFIFLRVRKFINIRECLRVDEGFYINSIGEFLLKVRIFGESDPDSFKPLLLSVCFLSL